MAVTEKEKSEVLQALGEGKKISEISDIVGLSRDTIRKIKNAATSNPDKQDLEKFNETFEVSGQEKTAQQLMKEVGALAPKILKERLDAGEIALNLCGNLAAAADMSLKDYIQCLIGALREYAILKKENEELTELIEQQNKTIDLQVDRAVIKKSINDITLLAVMCNRDISFEFLDGYQKMMYTDYFEDPKMHEARKKRMLQETSIQQLADEVIARGLYEN